MDERELREIETMHNQGGILPGDVPRLIAEVRRLAAENEALRARAVPALGWNRLATESHASSGEMELRVDKYPGFIQWSICWGGESLGDYATSLSDGEAKCEAAFLRLVGCK